MELTSGEVDFRQLGVRDLDAELGWERSSNRAWTSSPAVEVATPISETIAWRETHGRISLGEWPADGVQPELAQNL